MTATARSPSLTLLVRAVALAGLLLTSACATPVPDACAGALTRDTAADCGFVAWESSETPVARTKWAAGSDVHVSVGAGARPEFRLEHVQSGLAVRVEQLDTVDGERIKDGEELRFRGTSALGDVRLRRPPEGLEDFIELAKRPAVEAVRYRLTLDGRTAGLRLIEHAVELLDAGGAPRLRMGAPWLRTRDGAEVLATTRLIDCDADDDPRMPWNRPVIAPGAERCTVEIAWNLPEESYPAVLDPAWTVTSAMVHPRYGPGFARLSDGRLMLIGQLSVPTFGPPVEIYDLRTGSFAIAARPSGEIGTPDAVTLPDGRVFAMGAGERAYFYSIETGAWTEAPRPPATFAGPLLSLLDSGHVMVIMTNEADRVGIFDITSNAWISGSLPVFPLRGVRLVAIPGGKAVAFGRNNATLRNNFIEISATGQIRNLPMSSIDHGALPGLIRETTGTLLLSSGTVIVDGSSRWLRNVDRYDPTLRTWSAAPLLNHASEHALARTASGRIIFSGNFGQYRMEVLAPGASQWLLTDPPPFALGLKLGRVGAEGVLRTHQVESRQAVVYGLRACTLTSECDSGFCVDGFCCDSACLGGCNRCDVPLLEGACTVLPAGRGGSDPSCAPNACDGTSPFCPGECATDFNCSADRYCDDQICKPRAILGTGCAEDRECLSQRCVSGICCDSACTGPCETCFSAASPGICKPTPVGEVVCGRYRCDGVQRVCPNTCTVHGDCAPDDWCWLGECIDELPLGAPCTAAGQCATNSCVQGVCCESACATACARCDLAATLGLCRAAPAGSRVAGCTPYVCDGIGGGCPASCEGDSGCAPGFRCDSDICVTGHPDGTACTAGSTCASQSCADGVCCDRACGGACEECDDGTCSPLAARVVSEGAACGRYLCNGVAGSCPTSCSIDAACSTGHWCDGGRCAVKRTLGATCSRAGECGSGHCTDGVCCEGACAAQCGSCNGSGTAGLCRPVTGAPYGERPACEGAGVCGARCDGSRLDTCVFPSASRSCALPTCDGDELIAGAGCNGAGGCLTGARTSCAPFACNGGACLAACADDGDCAGGYWCDAGTCRAVLEEGATCSRAEACSSGFCVDGRCCDDACDGDCERCDRTSIEGTCGSVSPGGEREPGVCRPFVCTGTAGDCGATCLGAFDCDDSAFCSSGICEPRRPIGGSCGAATDCVSGFCVDGVCCDRTCNGQCESCARTGTGGTCGPVVGAPVGGRLACTGDGTACQGVCDGVSTMACRFPTAEIVCVTASCEAGIGTPESRCRGEGSCPGSTPVACDPFVCEGAVCATSCIDDAGCLANYRCAEGRCVPRRAAGASCDADMECSTGHCSDGTCCETACAGGCERCDLAASRGTCIAVQDVMGLETLGRCAPFACDGTRESCPTRCTADGHCLEAYRCEAGACVPRAEAGTTCSAERDCASGFCVDNVCCESACTGSCETCSAAGSEGTCTFVTGASVPGHAVCAGEGVCAGACDGSGADCAYPDVATACAAVSCSVDTAIGAAFCDGRGTCGPGAESSCEGRGCRGDVCEPPYPEFDGGCGCTGSEAGALALGLLGLVCRRRRSRNLGPPRCRLRGEEDVAAGLAT